MRLTSKDKSDILNRLPNLKLSYETTHNKVSRYVLSNSFRKEAFIVVHLF